MRFVNRQELMQMPEGTLFCAMHRPWSFGELCIKGETIVWNGKPGDFGERTLQWVDSNNSNESDMRLEMMLHDSSVSFPVESAYGREGLFDDNMKYLVYEKADVESIINDLTAYCLTPPKENDRV